MLQVGRGRRRDVYTEDDDDDGGGGGGVFS